MDLGEWLTYLRDKKRELNAAKDEAASSAKSLEEYDDAREAIIRKIIAIEERERATMYDPKDKDYHRDRDEVTASMGGLS